MARMSHSIRGIQEAQRRNLRTIQEMQPTGAFGEAVKTGLTLAHAYTVMITHVGRYRRHGRDIGGGSLRASHRIAYAGKLEGRIYIDPSSINPVTRQKPSVYGIAEHARGGSHAFYERTERERGRAIASRAGAILYRSL